MNTFRKKLLSTGLFIVAVIFCSTMLTLIVVRAGRFRASDTPTPPVRYGTVDGFFTGQDVITYPLLFEHLRTTSSRGETSLLFGPDPFEKFQMFMSVTKTTKAGAEKMKRDYMDRGAVSEGQRFPSGYTGELLSSDLKAHPRADTQSCSFGYTYFIPLMTSDHALVVDINAQDPLWGTSNSATMAQGISSFGPCALFEDANYTAVKAIMDHVISSVAPAF